MCRVDADCGRADEVCSGGICLRRGGGASAVSAVELTSPAVGAQLSRAFRVSARVIGDAEQVTFVVSNSATGAPLGELAVKDSAAQTWTGTLTLDAVAFGGEASVRAVAHRGGQPDVASGAVAVVIDQNAPAVAAASAGEWYARDAGVRVVATVTDDRSGVASAGLELPDGGTYAGSIDGSVATFDVPARDLGAPGAAAAVPFTIWATDGAGNRTRVDGAPLHVDDEGPEVSLVPPQAGDWFGAALEVKAAIGDGAGSGVSSARLLLDGLAGSADEPAGAAWTFHADLPRLLPDHEGPVTLRVEATDLVGNVGATEQTIHVDTVAPAIRAALVDSPPDGVDAAGQPWFRGPTLGGAAGAIVISAMIADANLVTAGSSVPAALVGDTRYPGAPATGGRWTFAIPRSVGLAARGPVVVTFDAQDLAGNHPLASPSVALFFDDMASFNPLVAQDATWYARAPNVAPAVIVTFPAPPTSGVASVVLRGAGFADVDCANIQSGWSCKLPSMAAPASAEAALPFEVSATSVVGVTATSSGTRSFDDAAPIVSAAASVPYPASTGPLAWSHDGAHFNARDSGTLYTFSAYDCGSGVRSASAFSLNPQPATRSVRFTDSGTRQTCPNGTVAIVYDVAVSADLATVPADAFPSADNVLNVSVTVVDGAADPAGGEVPHPGSASKKVTVTRRLWQTGAVGYSRLALGPVPVAASPSAVTAFKAADGSELWTLQPGHVLAGPAVGGSQGSPAVFFVTGSETDPGASLHQVSAVDGASGNECSFLASPVSTCKGGFRTQFASLAIAADGSAVLADNFLVSEGIAGAESSCWSAAYTLARGCSTWVASTGGHNLEGPFIGRQGRAFFIDTQTNAITGAQSQWMQERSLGGAATPSGPPCAGLDLLTDRGGADAPVCDGTRYSFSDSGTYTPLWNGSAAPLLTLPPLDLFFAASGATYSIATGLAINGFNGAGVPLLIDGSAAPVLYSASGTVLSALRIGPNGYAGIALGLPALPGNSIDDVALDGAGILYVASNGQISAIATSSPGLARGASWAARNRDNCRSSNLEFACPY